jgi:VWFA-related protein
MRNIAWIAVPVLLFGQSPAPLALAQESPSIKVEVNVVNVVFNVRDKRGGLIGNLSKDDFTIFEDGKPQEIKYFTRETDIPVTIGLLIDVSASQENLIGIEQQAAYQFFGQVLRPKDLAFLISFGADAELLQDYTNSPKLLRAGLQGLKVNSSVGGLHPGPVPTVYQPRGTILYDAVYLAAHDQLKGQVGRKALVLITDGEDQGSRYKIQEAIEAAQKADTTIYSIYYVDRGFYMRNGGMFNFGGGGEGYLKRMSDETGGQVFKVDRKHTLEDVFKDIQDAMRSQYAIGYQPTNPTKDGTFRRIEIRAKGNDYKIQARKGYYATKSEE